MDFSKTQKVKKVNPRTMIVAVDIGKGFHVGYFRAPNGEVQKPFLFSNSAKSFNEFWGRMREFSGRHALEQVLAGFESSGPYAELLFHYLRKKPVKLVQVNPFHTKCVKGLTGNSPNKTDHKDPRMRSRSVQMSGKNALLFSPAMIRSLPKELGPKIRR